VALAVGAAVQLLRAPEASGAAFTSAGLVPRVLLSRRHDLGGLTDCERGSLVVMHGGASRQGKLYRPKKLSQRFIESLDRRHVEMVPGWLSKLTCKPEATLDKWSQTLKVTFLEGEDELVTEDELKAHFTTKEYAPEAVIVGHKVPNDKTAHAYVHFSTNEACKKARYEKDGGPVGKATEVKVVYTDEKKWIRVRDGVAKPSFKRAAWMKAYGNQAQYEFTEEGWKNQIPREHPVYPEE